MDSDGEGFYDEDDICYADSDNEVAMSSSSIGEAEGDSYALAEEETTSRIQEKDYIILSQEDIKNNLEKDISAIMNVLFVSKGAACALLRHYAWRVTAVEEQWFLDEEKVRQCVGLFVEQKFPNTAGKQICNICFDETTDDMISAACGEHLYCKDCWKSYVSISIADGLDCLMLRCPEPSCKAVVDTDMIDMLASDEDKVKYYNYLHRSYVEDNVERRWCPAPGCEYAVQFDCGSGKNENFDVVCRCSYLFCWKCGEERHRPVDCETIEKWVQKNRNDAENANWLLAYTKQCPKCKRAIEKNQGCNHMTCGAPCRYAFCWHCLEAWKGHSNCNKFVLDDGTRKNVQRELERYAHYYQRWASNKKSVGIALSDLEKANAYNIDKLGIVQAALAKVGFVKDAWEQIVECRRTLTWTYAYAFYIPENEKNKTSFFEYLQGEAESALERLHHCAEKEMEKYIKAEGPLDDFDDFRTKLVTLTKVTKSFFENLVQALENGLSEVDDSKTMKENTDAGDAKITKKNKATVALSTRLYKRSRT